MLKQQAHILHRIAIALDSLALVGAFFAAYYVRQTRLHELNDYFWLLLFALPFWFLLLNHFRLYESLRVRSYRDIIMALFKVHVVGGVLLASIVFAMAPHTYSRLLFILFIGFSFLFMTGFKAFIKLVISFLRSKGYNYRNILIVGTGTRAIQFHSMINSHHQWGLNIVGLISVNEYDPASLPEDCPVVGGIDDLVDICTSHTVDEVVFAVDHKKVSELEVSFNELQDRGIVVRVIIDYFLSFQAKKEISLIDNKIPLITYSGISLDHDQLIAKRIMDFLGGVVGASLTLLLLPFIALAIKIDSPGPIFFGQQRVRENGRHFTCFKFRTMYVDAEERKKELMAMNEMQGAMFKMKNDPRITRVGRFLRKTSLDEFPQFWNVLRGEMSLVGTRPPTPDEVATYLNWHRRRISIKPGITGLWQVSGRNEVTAFDDVVRLDLQYIDTWTIWLDIKILLKTFLVLVDRRGAS